jgi:VanZ family protein
MFRIAGLVGLGLIVVVSVVPGTIRPHTSMSGYTEHFLAYAIVASCFALGWRSPLYQAAVVISAFIVASLLEAVQFLCPGRSPDSVSPIVSGIGGLCGVILATLLICFWRSVLQLSRNRTPQSSDR